MRVLTGERRGRWSPHGLLAVDGHRRTFPRLLEVLNRAPRSRRNRCRQRLTDSRGEITGELRLPLHPSLQGAGAPTPPRIPQTPAHGIICPPSPRQARSRAQRGGTICNRGFLVHSSSEIDLLVVRDSDLSRRVRSRPASVPFDALEHHWIWTL